MRISLPFLISLPLVAALGCGGSSDPASDTPQARVSFIDATTEAGLGSFLHLNGARGDYWFPETMGSGGGFVDVDSDGLPDIVLVRGGTWTETDGAPLHVFLNQGDGTFQRRPDLEPAGLSTYGFGIAAADYDNDGDQDIFYASLGQDALLRNDEGVLVDVSAQAGLSPLDGWSTAVTFLDADGDGWLDLYVGRYVDWTPETDIYCSQDGETKGYCTPELYVGSRATFLRNRGDGTFEDRTEAAGFAHVNGKALGALALDFNRDGWTDLMLANDTEADELYQNLGNGRFEDVGVVSGMAFDERGRARAGMGVEAGVVDDSGQETIFVGNFSSEMIGVYRYMGNDVFLDRAAASQIGQPSLLTLSFGMSLLDMDLDGDLDLFVGNGHVQPQIERVKENVRFRQAPHLFLNQGDATFVDGAHDSGLDFGSGWLARGVAWADYDQDGDPDLLVTENGGGVHLLRNETNSSNWVQVALRGTRSNRDGIGATVSLWTSGKSQQRFVRSGGSYLSQSELAPLFGMGPDTLADSVVVRWPSAATSVVVGVEAGTRIQITER